MKDSLVASGWWLVAGRSQEAENSRIQEFLTSLNSWLLSVTFDPQGAIEDQPPAQLSKDRVFFADAKPEFSSSFWDFSSL
jgi:hypothetical protein